MKDKYKEYIDYIAKDIQVPYLKSLEPYGLKQDEIVLVLSKIFNQPVIIKGDYVYSKEGNKLYLENSDGYWQKLEYDNDGNKIYYENSNGFIEDNRFDNVNN